MADEVRLITAKDAKKLSKAEDENAPLSPLQETFVSAYLVSMNYAEAARAIGTKSKYPNQIGYLMAQKPNVAKRIREARELRAQKAKVDTTYVLEGLKEVAHRCMQKVPVLEWNGVEWVETGEWKFDAAGANKAYELIGKHIGFFEQDNQTKRALIQINIDHDDMGL